MSIGSPECFEQLADRVLAFTASLKQQHGAVFSTDQALPPQVLSLLESQGRHEQAEQLRDHFHRTQSSELPSAITVATAVERAFTALGVCTQSPQSAPQSVNQLPSVASGGQQSDVAVQAESCIHQFRSKFERFKGCGTARHQDIDAIEANLITIRSVHRQLHEQHDQMLRCSTLHAGNQSPCTGQSKHDGVTTQRQELPVATVAGGSGEDANQTTQRFTEQLTLREVSGVTTIMEVHARETQIRADQMEKQLHGLRSGHS